MLDFLYTAVSWVLLRWHDLFVLLGFSETSGLGWVLSIVFLVITARLLLFRLFVKQVHYQRNMQKMQPKLQKIREKYKNDKQEMNRQLMKFQQEEGFNPLSGCLPMLLQIPVFIGLYHSLRHLANSASQLTSRSGEPLFITINGDRVARTLCNEKNGGPGPSDLLSLYTFTPQQTCDGAKAQLFGAPLAASFRDGGDVISQLGGDPTTTRFVILPLLIISAAATFLTQLMVRRAATTVPEGQAALIQKFMLYVIPLGVMASGLLFNFPLGVLLYWFTSNLWTLAQQAYIIKFHPPADEPVEATGQLGKTLAPKVGQRPQRPPRGGASRVDVTKRDATDDELAETSGATSGSGNPPAGGSAKQGGAQPVRGSVPRPGQRPNRGKRPPAKKASQAKKRR